MSNACLILFAKAPIAGRVKTRLIPAVGATAAAELYRRLLEHTLAAASKLHDVKKELWWDGPKDADGRAYAGRHDMTLQRQKGADLGERMHNALESALQTAERAVLIGSDSPEYDVDYLRGAFRALNSYDAVLGPAADGGYLLIGMRRPAPHLFRGIPWSTDGVLEITRQRLSELGWQWEELPVLRDIDEAADLVQFPGWINVIYR